MAAKHLVEFVGCCGHAIFILAAMFGEGRDKQETQARRRMKICKVEKGATILDNVVLLDCLKTTRIGRRKKHTQKILLAGKFNFGVFLLCRREYCPVVFFILLPCPCLRRHCPRRYPQEECPQYHHHIPNIPMNFLHQHHPQR